LYLPSYSPDYNPIEEAFAKIKHLLRQAAARSKEAVLEAIGAALSASAWRTPKASSSTLATTERLSYCETRC
jgi:transposase